MSYANTWTNNRPLGSGQAATADDEIRALRLDIQQRMDTLVVSWAADPIVLRRDALVAEGTHSLCIPSSAFTPTEDQDDVTWFDEYVQSDNSGDREMKAPVILVAGAKITKVEFLWNKQSLAGVVGDLLRQSFDTSHTLTTIAHVENTGAGTVLSPSGDFEETVSADAMYFVRIKPSSTLVTDRVVIYGVRITYKVDDFVAAVE